MSAEIEDMSFILDTFEKVSVNAIKAALRELGQKDDNDSAMAILAKVGTRITFGKNVYDPILMKQKP